MYFTTRDYVPAFVGKTTGRVYSDELRQGVQRYLFDLLAKGTINITGAVTRIINRGSVLGAFNYIGLQDGGDDVVKIDARTLGFFADLMAPSPLTVKRLTGTGVAATTLAELKRFAFALPIPHAAIPQETVYVQADPDKKMRLFAELRSDGGQVGLVSGGVSAMTVVPQLEALDRYDDLTTKPPALIEGVEEETVPISAASTAKKYPFSLAGFRALRGIIIQCDSDQGEVGDVVNALKLKVAGRDVIGPTMVPWELLTRTMEADYGGSVYADGTSYGQRAYLYVDFQENGRLSNVLPASLPNAEFTLDVQPSAQAGVTSTNLRFTFLGLRQIAGVTAKTLPFNI
jgi:hypothetical protein